MPPIPRPHVTIYTDGACAGNPGPGGWAALLIMDSAPGSREKALTGAASETTNNRMELRAVIAALSALKKPCRVDLYTDSEYVMNGITTWVATWRRNRWLTAKKEPVKNQDLWRKMITLVEIHEVRWEWVRGHAANPNNERVDTLAREAIGRLAANAAPDLDPTSDRLPY
jgi:ribonuclease HI